MVEVPQTTLTITTGTPTVKTAIISARGKGYKPAPLDYGQSPHMLREWLRKTSEVANGVLNGKINATGSVTLTASSATTTLTDRRIGASSVILFMPTTSNAAGALSGLYVTARIEGQATLNHANNAQTDKTFSYAIFG